MGRSILAVVAGIVSVIVLTTIVDVVLHAVGFFAPLGQPLDDRQALVATVYRVILGIGGAWLTARLAPANPMTHVWVLAGLGTLAAVAGVVVTWNAGLGPRWYAIALAVLAIPQSWVGGRLYVPRRAVG